LKHLLALAFVLVLCPIAARAEPGKITKESFESGGKKRAYYLYVPKAVAEAKKPAPLTEIKGHTHDYYGISKDVNKLAWDFLKDKELAGEQKFTEYRYN